MKGRTAVLALALGSFIVAPALADDVADFYRNKTVTIVVGFTAGGSVVVTNANREVVAQAVHVVERGRTHGRERLYLLAVVVNETL